MAVGRRRLFTTPHRVLQCLPRVSVCVCMCCTCSWHYQIWCAESFRADFISSTGAAATVISSSPSLVCARDQILAAPVMQRLRLVCRHTRDPSAAARVSLRRTSEGDCVATCDRNPELCCGTFFSLAPSFELLLEMNNFIYLFIFGPLTFSSHHLLLLPPPPNKKLIFFFQVTCCYCHWVPLL